MKPEFVSLADNLRAKGRKEGLEQKNRTATENMLRKGYKVSEICEVQDVTPEYVEKVRKAMKN